MIISILNDVTVPQTPGDPVATLPVEDLGSTDYPTFFLNGGKIFNLF